MIRYISTFQKDHSKESLENAWKEAMKEGKEMVRKLAYYFSCKIIRVYTRAVEVEQKGRGGVRRYEKIKLIEFSYLLNTK